MRVGKLLWWQIHWMNLHRQLFSRKFLTGAQQLLCKTEGLLPLRRYFLILIDFSDKNIQDNQIELRRKAVFSSGKLVSSFERFSKTTPVFNRWMGSTGGFFLDYMSRYRGSSFHLTEFSDNLFPYQETWSIW